MQVIHGSWLRAEWNSGPPGLCAERDPWLCDPWHKMHVGSEQEGLGRFLSQRQDAGAPHHVRLEMGVGELVLS